MHKADSSVRPKLPAKSAMFLALLSCFLIAISAHANAANYALHFLGNGANDIDRLKIPIDNPARPADIGNGDMTIEFWMKANPGDNGVASACTSASDDWISGNIIFDRRISSNEYGYYGISLKNGKIDFGFRNSGGSSTVCGNTNVADGAWHQIVITRASGGEIRLYVDGILDGQVFGLGGRMDYLDGRATGSPTRDPFLVIGAEKYDMGPIYPSYKGFVDEIRLSPVNRISRLVQNFPRPANPYSPDANTSALYHLDEGSGTDVLDASGAAGGPSNGVINVGGNPQGPEWVESDAPISYNSDTQPPAVAITSPVPGAVLLGVVSFTVNASDSSGISEIHILVDGQLKTTAAQSIYFPASLYSITWNASLFSLNGQHTITARAKDAAGNLGESLPVDYTVSNPATTQTAFYIGNFVNSSPSDNPDCGFKPNPCATLEYWNRNRRAILIGTQCRSATICSVRIAPGYYGPSNSPYHCIIAQPFVQYEGRNSQDTLASSSSTATIDLSQTPNVQPCNARGVEQTGAGFSGFRLNSLTLLGPTNPDSCMSLTPLSSPTSTLRFTRTRFTGCRNGALGWNVGVADCPSSGLDCSRLLNDIIIINSEFDNNIGNGLYVGVVRLLQIKNSTFHNNGAHWCSFPNTNPLCDESFACNSDNNNCQDYSGITITGSVDSNGIIQSHAYRNSRDGFRITGTGSRGFCDAFTKKIDIFKSSSYDNGHSSYGFGGCANTVSLSASYAYGTGTGIDMGEGACGIKFYSNTIFMSNGWRALSSSSLHTNMSFVDNIFISDNPDSTVQLTTAMVQPQNGGTWDGNIVLNSGVGDAIRISGSQPNDYDLINIDPDYACARLTSPRGDGDAYDDKNRPNHNVISDWRNKAYFGAGTSSNDKWGVMPLFINNKFLHPIYLHLSPADSIAKDSGITLPAFYSADYDGDLRPAGAAWDIGADEAKSTIPQEDYDFVLSTYGGDAVRQGKSTLRTIRADFPYTALMPQISFVQSGAPQVSDSTFMDNGGGSSCTAVLCSSYTQTLLNISTNESTPVGNYTITVQGDLNGISKFTSFNLAVNDATAPSCDWDFFPRDSGDGKVALGDVLVVVSDYGKNESSPSFNPRQDFNNNKRIDLFDVLTVLANLGKC